jgi:carotenoid 1,2-hydratase
MTVPGLAFDRSVPSGGYAWWYLDGLSDDGRYGITLIAFLGSVFSPYYASARRQSALADPLAHCAVNVALYGTGGGCWAMTERSERALHRDATTLAIGPSHLTWDGQTLTVVVDEVTAPWHSRLRGTVKLMPQSWAGQRYPLDEAARHHWQPLAPCARITVDFQQPALRWSGEGYLDSNQGERALETDFQRWHWSRASVQGAAQGQRDTAVLYDVTPRHGTRAPLALRFGNDGSVSPFAPPPLAALPDSSWRVQRQTRSEAQATTRVLQTLEDGPFYARSVVTSQLLGQQVQAVHESLCLDRFGARWVQALLPFRMPRRA